MRRDDVRSLQPRAFAGAVLPLLPALVVVVIAVLLGRALALAELL
ncbi:hypothetical protein SAMN05216567_10115 [Variovorax sp. OK605]|nr:hypothetical protein SAMN05216567_10115 [Variovorax sp. OK605]